jgi:hypothetical protein
MSCGELLTPFGGASDLQCVTAVVRRSRLACESSGLERKFQTRELWQLAPRPRAQPWRAVGVIAPSAHQAACAGVHAQAFKHVDEIFRTHITGRAGCERTSADAAERALK